MRNAERLIKLQVLLAEKNLTRSEVAKAAGVSPTIFSWIMMGRVIPTAQEQVKISEALGVKIDEIF